jgi:hypothetical protein
MKSEMPIGNAFGRLLSEFRRGASLAELSEAMQMCIAAVKDTGKAAELKYVVKFTPSGNAIVVTDKVDKKLPGLEREQSIFFATQDNMLTRSDPGQRELELREVEKPAVMVHEVESRAAVAAGK